MRPPKFGLGAAAKRSKVAGRGQKAPGTDKFALHALLFEVFDPAKPVRVTFVALQKPQGFGVPPVPAPAVSLRSDFLRLHLLNDQFPLQNRRRAHQRAQTSPARLSQTPKLA